MAFVRGFFAFWYDFIIGDDWKIALAVVLALGAGAVAVLAGYAASALLAPLVALAVLVAFTIALVVDVRVSCWRVRGEPGAVRHRPGPMPRRHRRPSGFPGHEGRLCRSAFPVFRRRAASAKRIGEVVRSRNTKY
jgi:hypothetical protein